jgi:UDP-glucose 4-epimerase
MPVRKVPMPQVVLLTGVSQFVGSRLAAQLSADPSIDRIIGVDTVPPAPADVARLGRTEFVRADIRNPLIARIVAQAKVETVVHASVTAMPRGASGRASVKEMNVIGTMQLLAACQKSETVRRLVVKSTTTVYGSSPRDQAVFDEKMSAHAVPTSGYAKDAIEVESYVRGFSRRRPDITVSVLRLTNFIGPTVETPLSRYLAMPVVPTALGYDPRLQMIHEADALEVLRLATTSDRPGVYNVAGSGTLVLSQAIRRAGRVQLPVPGPAVEWVGRLVRRSGMVDFSPSQMQFLNFGRVVDITKLETEFAYSPRYSTAEAFESFLAERPLTPVISAHQLEQAEQFVGHALGVGRAQAVAHG